MVPLIMGSWDDRSRSPRRDERLIVALMSVSDVEGAKFAGNDGWKVLEIIS